MNKNIGSLLFLFVGLVLLLAAGSTFLNLYVDWLFFVETSFTSVFKTTLMTKVLSALLFSAAFLVFYLIHIILANRVKFPLRNLHIFGDTVQPVKTISVEKPVKFVSLAGGLVLAVLIGFFGASQWEQVLLFMNRLEVGMSDPVFNRDIGFYLFTLPLVDTVRNFAFLSIVLTFAITAAGYFLRGGISITEKSIAFYPEVKKHLALFGFFVLVVIALTFYVQSFQLLYSQKGFIFGAGYTDIKVRLFCLRLMSGLCLLTAVAFLAAMLKGSFRWVLYPAAVAAVVYVGGIILIAPLLQKFKVAPNELELERPYIKNNISMTRFGYDLDSIEVKSFDVDHSLTAPDIAANDATIRNIRLWDNTPLLRTYSQLQQIRTYYRFTDVDNDRYTIDGEYMQVMLSPRELSYSDLPSKSWINERLVFTHGNGLAMGPVSRISREGLPEFLIKDIPPSSDVSITVTRPEIYYGEIPNDYVIVKTSAQEFDYPTATENVYSSYEGTGGISLDSIIARTIFSVKFNTAKIFLSSDITPESRILMYRNISSRIAKIAPFLLFDSDPYMVISNEGKLFWIVDCYTVSDNLPYSMPFNRNVNYIRNSVKAVVDAYNGTVSFYISDPDDVMIKVYAQAFPGLFRDIEEMPQTLRSHIRYPQGIMEVQARMYSSYHMTDPTVFYNKEDLWEIPSYSDKPMEPYNTIMKLPGEKKEEYILLIPYTPSKRDNLAAWMAARCDMPEYGKLIVYVFPRDRLVFGPRQVNARIDQDAYISQQITLWGQVGSQVIRGSLLIIPIENSLLYIQPLYLSASDRVGLPELRRVIVAYENDVVMEENLELALQRLFNQGKKIKLRKQAVSTGTPVAEDSLTQEAMKVYEQALEMQRQGDWAGYGEQIEKLGQLLKQMAQ